MNRNLRKRVFRNFVASLLLSDISHVEMRELASELDNGDLALELSELVRNMSDLMASEANSSKKEPTRKGQSADPRIRTVMNAILRRRLTKKVVWELMRAASPNFSPDYFSPNATLKEQVSGYLTMASNNDAAKFLTLIEGRETADPYLKGISNRS
jgi:hypothetical protein